jgi:hypothetical protein
MRKTTSKVFRDYFKANYPGLDNDPTYWRLLRYLLFGIRTKEGDLLIDGWHLSKAEEKTHLYRYNNYCGIDFLNRFKSDVLTDLMWSNWDYKEGKARVAYPNFPIEVLELLDKEPTNMKECRVYFDTGLKFSRKRQKIDLEIMREEALTYFEFARPESQGLLEYMNNLPTNSFSKIIEANFESTWIAASKLQDPLSKRVQVEILLTIKDELRPLYKPSIKGNTVRIFPFNASIPMLRRDLRKKLCKGWYEFDLANSQLAIIGKTWNVTEVQDYLLANRKIWVELFTHFGVDAATLKVQDSDKYEGIKKVFKDNLYSTIYGMSPSNVIKDVTTRLEVWGIYSGGNEFVNFPLVKTLFTAREERMDYLSSVGKSQTIFGKELVVTGGFNKKGKPDLDRRASLRSILAEEAQAIELYIMLPVLDLAKSTNNFLITLWQHDGFSVNFTDKTKKDIWLKRIVNSINQRASELGIVTQLESALLEG